MGLSAGQDSPGGYEDAAASSIASFASRSASLLSSRGYVLELHVADPPYEVGGLLPEGPQAGMLHAEFAAHLLHQEE